MRFGACVSKTPCQNRNPWVQGLARCFAYACTNSHPNRSKFGGNIAQIGAHQFSLSSINFVINSTPQGPWERKDQKTRVTPYEHLIRVHVCHHPFANVLRFVISLHFFSPSHLHGPFTFTLSSRSHVPHHQSIAFRCHQNPLSPWSVDDKTKASPWPTSPSLHLVNHRRRVEHSRLPLEKNHFVRSLSSHFLSSVVLPYSTIRHPLVLPTTFQHTDVG